MIDWMAEDGIVGTYNGSQAREVIDATGLIVSPGLVDTPMGRSEVASGNGSAEIGEAIAWLYRNGRVVERTDDEEGVRLSVRLDRQAIGRFEQISNYHLGTGRPQGASARGRRGGRHR
mgnify:CR=1 FL=1